MSLAVFSWRLPPGCSPHAAFQSRAREFSPSFVWVLPCACCSGLGPCSLSLCRIGLCLCSHLAPLPRTNLPLLPWPLSQLRHSLAVLNSDMVFLPRHSSHQPPGFRGWIWDDIVFSKYLRRRRCLPFGILLSFFKMWPGSGFKMSHCMFWKFLWVLRLDFGWHVLFLKTVSAAATFPL